MIEVAIRVESVRPFAVETMLSMLLNDSLLLGQVESLQLFPHNILITFHEIFMHTNINLLQARATVCEVLRAAAWVVGEYSDIVSLIAADTNGDSLDGESDDEDEGINSPSLSIF